ncbi:MAG: hypothetical protein MI749_10000 [Desulfovibrionales bacterium]|nr:hypothetical protein [Desulfovibrionales bacterium]
MSKGYNKNKERLEQVALLGKTLVRRGKKKCELCGTQGVSMAVVEVAPAPAEPDADHAILICGTCQALVEAGRPDPDGARFLETAVWNEIPAIQVTAVRLCRTLAAADIHWARELLDMVYLSPESEAWLEGA